MLLLRYQSGREPKSKPNNRCCRTTYFEPPQEPVSVDPLQVLPVKVKDIVYLRLTIAEDLLPLKTSRLIEMSLDEGATWSEISRSKKTIFEAAKKR